MLKRFVNLSLTFVFLSTLVFPSIVAFADAGTSSTPDAAAEQSISSEENNREHIQAEDYAVTLEPSSSETPDTCASDEDSVFDGASEICTDGEAATDAPADDAAPADEGDAQETAVDGEADDDAPADDAAPADEGDAQETAVASEADDDTPADDAAPADESDAQETAVDSEAVTDAPADDTAPADEDDAQETAVASEAAASLPGDAFVLVLNTSGEVVDIMTPEGEHINPLSEEGASILSALSSDQIPDDILRSAPNDWFYQNGFQDNLDAIQAPQAWDVSTGQNVIVAVIDTGVETFHNDIGGPNYGDGNIWTNAAEVNGTGGVDDDGNGYTDDLEGWNFSTNGNNVYDSNGHGTHVAGIIGAVTNNNYGMAGAAPDVLIMPVVYGADIAGSAAAIRYAADNGAKIINMSWGYNQGQLTPAEIQVLQEAIDYAYQNGVTLIAASGNCDRQGPNDNNPQKNDCTQALYPAHFDNVISVAAVDANEALKYSGLKTDIVAPGVGILSALPDGAIDNTDYFGAMSGSSMASPHVAAVAALLYSHGITDPAAIRQRLLDTAKDLGACGFDNEYGAGLVQAYNALLNIITTRPDCAAALVKALEDELDGPTILFAHSKFAVQLNGTRLQIVGVGNRQILISLEKSQWANVSPGSVFLTYPVPEADVVVVLVLSSPGTIEIQLYSTLNGELIESTSAQIP